MRNESKSFPSFAPPRRACECGLAKSTTTSLKKKCSAADEINFS